MEKDKYLFECTELQLQEIEILQSIYSNTNEFFIEGILATLFALTYFYSLYYVNHESKY